MQITANHIYSLYIPRRSTHTQVEIYKAPSNIMCSKKCESIETGISCSRGYIMRVYVISYNEALHEPQTIN